MKRYFSTFELTLLFISIFFILASFFIFDRENYLTLIALWIAASGNNLSYLSVIICFITFLANDIYGFISWKRIERRQLNNE